MKPSGLFLLIALLVFCSCSTTHYYIVRHAERLDNTDNSPLNQAGLTRAQVLADTLRNKNIQRIYISDKQRTAQTVAPTASLFSLTPVVVPANQTWNLLSQLRTEKGKTILVVRHSNEIHQIVNDLSPFDQIQPISDEFHLMFFIKRRIFLFQKTYTLKRLMYGAQ